MLLALADRTVPDEVVQFILKSGPPLVVIRKKPRSDPLFPEARPACPSSRICLSRQSGMKRTLRGYSPESSLIQNLPQSLVVMCWFHSPSLFCMRAGRDLGKTPSDQYCFRAWMSLDRYCCSIMSRGSSSMASTVKIIFFSSTGPRGSARDRKSAGILMPFLCWVAKSNCRARSWKSNSILFFARGSFCRGLWSVKSTKQTPRRWSKNLLMAHTAVAISSRYREKVFSFSCSNQEALQME